MSQAIKLKNLCKIYKQQGGSLFKAVDDINLEVPKGEVVGFLGPNGAGKTTTIKMICNLITPTSGSIYLNGYDIAKHRMSAMLQIGAVLEGARNTYWQLSPWQNLIYFGQIKGIFGTPLKNQAEKLLKELDLWQRKDDLVSEFSRGMQQKVAIACALISNPQIIILDEPTLGLDLQGSHTVKLWIENLAHNEGKTVILTTHQLEVAEQLCKRIVIVNQGKICIDKPTHELLANAQEPQYKFIIAGKINKDSRLFSDMTIIENLDETICIGAIKDQEILHDKLNALRDLNIPLISVNKINKNLEELFVQITKQQSLNI